ncbi:MAG TPA: hypothetical protein PLU72_02515 [Candidatus Ozemobacteraceae bacterium]|nr:hypothetical protein [Candidatus Ozemobacteraceae bacterium]
MFALLLIGGYFIQYMVRQSRAGHKQAQQRITGVLANSLAQLAAQKIQHDILLRTDHPLVTYLRKPAGSMGELSRTANPPIALDSGTPDFSNVVSELIKPLAAHGTFNYEIRYECRQSDFSTISPKFPREKSGIIHLYVTIRYKKTNGPEYPEDYHYALRVKVTAAIIPVLSKFNLYVEDALDGSPTRSPWRFNLAATDVTGNLQTGSQVTPWVLWNGDDQLSLSSLTFDSLVQGKRGLIYLGGGRVYLNLARGWPSPGKFAEGFQLFKSGKGDGLYTIEWLDDGGEIALLGWDQGTTFDTTSSGAREWWGFIANSKLASLARFNSIFRLYGTDSKKSPTLVLGEVFRSYITAKAIKDVRKRFSPDFLNYIPGDSGNLTYWQEYLTPMPMPENDNISTFTTLIKPAERASFFDPSSAESLKRFNQKYASNLAYSPYNLSIAVMVTNNNLAFPLQSLQTSPLITLMNSNPLPPADMMHAIPAPFNTLTGATSLKSMAPFITAMNVPGKRTSWTLPASNAPQDIWNNLRDRGLLKGNKLDLNGWVYVPGAADMVIKDNLDVISNGGIVLEKGNILISNKINATVGSEFKVLQLVTLDGDITLDINGPVQAALTAPKGRVTVTDNGRPQIKGAVAMKRFDISSASQGAELEYALPLAALPEQTADEMSEQDLLSFTLNPTPLQLK